MKRTLRYRGRGFVPLEMLAVVCIIAILLGLGVVVVSNARGQAHLTQAESRLRQVSVALDLYFKKNGHYPPAGCNLAEALAEFAPTPEVFENPLMSEPTLGYTLSRMYAEPSNGAYDEPEVLLTALLSAQGDSIVTLKTFGKVECLEAKYDPHSLISTSMVMGCGSLGVSEDGVSRTSYNVENEDGEDAVTVKFEATGDQLGDEDALEAHVFRIPVDNTGGVDSVTLTLKSGAEDPVTTSPLVPGTYDELPGEIGLEGTTPAGDYYVKCDIDPDTSEIVVTIISDSIDDGSQTPALSNWVCEIDGGARIMLGGGVARVDTIKLEL